MALSAAIKQIKAIALRVLIVEDEGLTATHISSLLKQGGYEVAGLTETSEDALASANSVHPDLVLMDIRIKGRMGAIETAQQIKQQLDIPIIFLVSQADEEATQAAKLSSSGSFLTKPIRSETLFTAIDMGISRYEAERQLRLQRGWLGTLLDALPEAMTIFDASGKIQFFSAGAEKLTGWSQEDAMNVGVSEVLPLTRGESGLTANEIYLVGTDDSAAYSLAEGLTTERFSGEKFRIEGEILPSFDEGRLIGAVFTFREANARR